MVMQVHAAHILVKTETEAKKVLEDLKSGVSFSNEAMLKSTCPSARRGGDLGWFGRNVMVKEFENAAFSGRKGEIIGPIRTQFGWHIIKVLENR